MVLFMSSSFVAKRSGRAEAESSIAWQEVLISAAPDGPAAPVPRIR